MGQKWLNIMKDMDFDSFLRLAVALLFFSWNVTEGSVFQTPQPKPLVVLYTQPIWRFLLIAILISAALWCPTVAIMATFSLFFYIMDMEALRKPFTK